MCRMPNVANVDRHSQEDNNPPELNAIRAGWFRGGLIEYLHKFGFSASHARARAIDGLPEGRCLISINTRKCGTYFWGRRVYAYVLSVHWYFVCHPQSKARHMNMRMVFAMFADNAVHRLCFCCCCLVFFFLLSLWLYPYLMTLLLCGIAGNRWGCVFFLF